MSQKMYSEVRAAEALCVSVKNSPGKSPCGEEENTVLRSATKGKSFLDRLNDALLLIFEMRPHDLSGGLTVMVEDGVKKLFMLCHQHGVLFNVTHILHAVAVKLLPEVVDDGDEAVVAGGVEDGVVETFVFFHNVQHIAVLYGLYKVRLMPAE